MAHIVCDEFFCLMFDACSVRCSSCCMLVQCGCTPRRLHLDVFSMKFTSALPTELMALIVCDNCFCLMFDACSVRRSSCCMLVQCRCCPRRLHLDVFSIKFSSALPTELMSHIVCYNFFCLMPVQIDALRVT